MTTEPRTSTGGESAVPTPPPQTIFDAARAGDIALLEVSSISDTSRALFNSKTSV